MQAPSDDFRMALAQGFLLPYGGQGVGPQKNGALIVGHAQRLGRIKGRRSFKLQRRRGFAKAVARDYQQYR
jgi:hypothetical protein